MKPNNHAFLKAAATACCLMALSLATQAQTVTNPVSNLVISWNLDDWSTVNPTDLAGLAPATNWVDTYLNNVTVDLPDNTGAATTLDLAYSSYNTYQVYSYHVGYDANGTANREMLNGFLNAGPAAWDPPVTNTYVALTNIPYAMYDVIVYFNSDTSGRNATIDNGSTTYNFSTMGSAAVSGANALLIPTTQTNSGVYPGADFAFFPGMTNVNAVITETPKSGNDQWLGIAGFQVIQSSNAYIVYGPNPATQIVPVGQRAAFNVMAGGLNPQYQWQHAGTNILNATNATYTIASTVLAQVGNYDVIVTNNFSSVTSVVATLTFYTPQTDVWAGTGSTWDTSSLNWTRNGGASDTNYTETDNVRFDPLGVAQPTVSLSGTFTPSSITVSNGSYTLTSGGLSGGGALSLKNNAALILDTIDNRTGPTLIDASSTLQLDNGDNAGVLGSGPLTNSGALLFNNSGSYAYGFPIYGAGSITNIGSGALTLANNINANYLVQAGSGSMLLQGNNSLTSGLIVSGGTLMARAAGCLAPNTVVSGGELQLIFNIDFTGSNIALAGGDLHGGISGDDSYDGTVTLAVDSQINVDGGDSLTLNNANGIIAGGYNLYLGGGGGTLILVGTNNSWESVTINAGTLQIGNGGATGSLGAGTISDVDALAFDLTGNLLVTNPITGGGSINQNGSGTVRFTGDLSTFNGNVTVSAGGLGGTTTIGGPVSVSPGATLSAGTLSVIGTLTLNAGLTLGGNLSVKINKSLTQSNDLVAVSGGLGNTNTGMVVVSNLGPALAAGDKFTLFSQPVIGGALLSVTGGGSGIVWSNNLANDGSIIVLSAAPPNPAIISASGKAGVLSLSWPASYLGWILQSQTNTLKIGISTNWVDVAGSATLTSTNLPINATVPTAFYRLRHP